MAVLKAILTYFALALIIFLSAYLFSTDVAMFFSVLLLIPILIWQENHPEKEKLSKQVDGRNKGTILFWIFTLFILALFVRIPSALLFGMPYEKTPLIYLTVFTIIAIEKTDISAFGFRTQNIGKAIFHGLIFYAILGGSALLTNYLLIYAFTNQTPVQSYVVAVFILAMPFHTLCVGVSEEGFFRGYVQTHLEKFYGTNKAILIQAVLFGIWHFVWDLNPFNPWGMIQYVAITFFIGLPFGYFYTKARNLASVVIAHGLWNSVQLGILANQAAFDALQAIPIAIQILIWFLPYAISVIAAILFVKFWVK
ncbi:MAG: CPBP family intramembrane metalloprotease [Candidatus Bathyarchaeota archaeon]|nr:CPBP family intramembrane metalloprotease [Candidatus Bathyarchaeota archaeon]